MDSDLFTYISDDDSQTHIMNHHYVFPFNYLIDIFRKDPDHQRILDPDWRIRNHLPSQTILKNTTPDRALLYLAYHLSVICVFILPPSEINLI